MNKLNKKGASLGVFIVIFMGIIVSIALYAGTFESVGNMRNIRTTVNETITTAAVNSSTTLTGRENTSAITVVNATNGSQDWSVNFTVTTKNTGGALAILLTTTDNAGLVGQNLTSLNVSYTYKPQGYNDSSGSRAIVGIILIFGALAIAVFVVPGFRDIFG